MLVEKSSRIERSVDSLGNTSHQLESCFEAGYRVYFTQGLLDVSNPSLAKGLHEQTVFIVADDKVWQLYGENLQKYLRHWGIANRIKVIRAGESQKRIESIEAILRWCLSNSIKRRDVILCFGGGVVSDLAALAASLLRRGCPCIKIPTTLMGMVDAAIGVKTGVNFASIKNSVGTYSIPAAVFCDVGFLRTLNRREMRCGIAEIMKIFAVKDRASWDRLAALGSTVFDDYESPAFRSIVEDSAYFMMDELRGNLYEQVLLRAVDYGHEFGHMVEMWSGHRVLHGEAVSIGMNIANAIALEAGVLSIEEMQEFKDVSLSFGLPIWDRSILMERLQQVAEKIRHQKNGSEVLTCISSIGNPFYLHGINQSGLIQAEKSLRYQ